MTALLVLALLAAGSAAAEGSGASAVSETTLGSVHALISRSMAEALSWSPNAKLYAVVGTGPKSGVLLEEWTLIYGDPIRQRGFYVVKFGDGVMLERLVGLEGAEVREWYWEGKLRNTMRQESGGFGDYMTNLPLNVKFLDAPALDSLLKRLRFSRPSDGRWSLELSRLMVPLRADGAPEQFPGFFLSHLFRSLGAVPDSGLERCMWIVDNGDDAVFLDAATGKLINSRVSVSKAPATGAVWRIKN